MGCIMSAVIHIWSPPSSIAPSPSPLPLSSPSCPSPLPSLFRYNISTGEYDGWNGNVNSNITRVTKTVLSSNVNAQATAAANTPVVRQANQAVSSLDVASYLGFGLNTTESYRVSVCLCVCVCVCVCVCLCERACIYVCTLPAKC